MKGKLIPLRDPIAKLERILSSEDAQTVYLTRAEAQTVLRYVRAAKTARALLTRLDWNIGKVIAELDGPARPEGEEA